jgi:hypothetical protein
MRYILVTAMDMDRNGGGGEKKSFAFTFTSDTLERSRNELVLVTQ